MASLTTFSLPSRLTDCHSWYRCAADVTIGQIGECGMKGRVIPWFVWCGALSVLVSCSGLTAENRTMTNNKPAAETLSDQESMALAVLLYSSRNPSYLGDNGRHFSLYLRLADQDPSAEFLRSLVGTGWKVFPHSQYRGQPGEMEVVVGRFVQTGPDGAKGGLGAICGPRCAGGDNFVLKKLGGAWTIESHRPQGVS